MCLHVVNTFPNLEQIDHIFMVSGDSHMEVDSMHSPIGKLQISLKNPYRIELFEQKDIKDLDQLTSDLKITNTSIDRDNSAGQVAKLITKIITSLQ